MNSFRRIWCELTLDADCVEWREKHEGEVLHRPNGILKHVNIPASVRSIGANAFADCNSLCLIRFRADAAYDLSDLSEVDKSKVYLQFSSLSETAKHANKDGWTVYLSAAE